MEVHRKWIGGKIRKALGEHRTALEDCNNQVLTPKSYWQYRESSQAGKIRFRVPLSTNETTFHGCFSEALIKALKPWEQPEVSLCWRDLTAIGTTTYATSGAVLEGGVPVFHFCVQERRRKALIFCTPRKKQSWWQCLVACIEFYLQCWLLRSLYSKNSHNLFRIAPLKAQPLNLQVLFAKRQSMPGQLESLWHTVCVFSSGLQTSISLSCEACAGELSPAPPSWKRLKRKFQQEERDDSKL